MIECSADATMSQGKSNNLAGELMKIKILGFVFAMAILITHKAHAQKWAIALTADPITDEPIALATLKARTGKGLFGIPIELAVGCLGDQAFVAVDWHDVMRRDGRIIVRLNSTEPREESWAVTQNGSIYRKNGASELITTMLTAERMVVRAWDINGAESTAIFDTTEFADEFSKMKHVCELDAEGNHVQAQ